MKRIVDCLVGEVIMTQQSFLAKWVQILRPVNIEVTTDPKVDKPTNITGHMVVIPIMGEVITTEAPHPVSKPQPPALEAVNILCSIQLANMSIRQCLIRIICETLLIVSFIY